VINISGSRAVVTQTSAPEEVVLTASIKNGEVAVTKDFTLVVAPDDDASSTSDEAVYFIGHGQNSSDRNVAGFLKNGAWNGAELSTPDSDIWSGFTVAKLGNDIYAFPNMNLDPAKRKTTGYWKNGTWTRLEPPSGVEESRVISLDSSGGEVYALGYNGVKPGYWKNGTWIDLPMDEDSLGQVYTSLLKLHGDDVYITGKHQFSAGYWKNGVWKSLSPSVPEGSALADSMHFYGTDIYTTGFFGASPTNEDREIGYWRNEEWVPVDSYRNRASSASFASVSEIALHEGETYALGYVGVSSPRPGTSYPGYWKNRTWTSFGHLVPMYSRVYDMAIFGCDLYAVGQAGSPYGELESGYWKNGVWNPFVLPEGLKSLVVTSISSGQPDQ
jgi:hypothetical protein